MSDELASTGNAARRFLVGPAGEGAWIVRDESGAGGAVFASRDDALHFAKGECEALAPLAAQCVLVAAMDWRSLFARRAKAA